MTHPNKKNTFLRPDYVLFMSEFPDDLKLVIESWDDLPEPVRVGILAMVEAARQH